MGTVLEVEELDVRCRGGGGGQWAKCLGKGRVGEH